MTFQLSSQRLPHYRSCPLRPAATTNTQGIFHQAATSSPKLLLSSLHPSKSRVACRRQSIVQRGSSRRPRRLSSLLGLPVSPSLALLLHHHATWPARAHFSPGWSGLRYRPPQLAERPTPKTQPADQECLRRYNLPSPVADALALALPHLHLLSPFHPSHLLHLFSAPFFAQHLRPPHALSISLSLSPRIPPHQQNDRRQSHLAFG